MELADYNDTTYDYTKYWEGRDYEHSSELLALGKIFKNLRIEKGKSVIDIGCGFGRLLPVLKKTFKDITLFDYSKKLLETAKKQAEIENIQIQTLCGDVYKISETTQRKYEFAVMNRVSHHIQDLGAVFNEINKIITPEGYFIFELANKLNFKAIVKALIILNFNFFSKDSISLTSKDSVFLNHNPAETEKLIKKAGFEIIKKYSVSNFRNPLLKKYVSDKILLELENILQEPLAYVNFGPSLYYVLRKQGEDASSSPRRRE